MNIARIKGSAVPRWTLLLLVLAAMTLLLVPDRDAEARKGFGGFGRSSIRTSSFGFSAGKSSRRSFGWGRASTRRSGAFGSSGRRSSGWGGGNMARRVGTKGRTFNSRSAAQQAYRSKLKTRWSGKPAKRPDYVPRSIERDGGRYDVVFNRGTYGYWGPGNSWVALGAGSMLAGGALLASRGYYYGSSGYGAGGGRFPVFLGALVLFAFVSSVGRRRAHF